MQIHSPFYLMVKHNQGVAIQRKKQRNNRSIPTINLSKRSHNQYNQSIKRTSYLTITNQPNIPTTQPKSSDLSIYQTFIDAASSFKLAVNRSGTNQTINLKNDETNNFAISQPRHQSSTHSAQLFHRSVVNESINQTSSHSIKPSIINQAINQSINHQSSNQSIHKSSIKQSVNQLSISQPNTCVTINQSINQSINQLNKQRK